MSRLGYIVTRLWPIIVKLSPILSGLVTITSRLWSFMRLWPIMRIMWSIMRRMWSIVRGLQSIDVSILSSNWRRFCEDVPGFGVLVYCWAMSGRSVGRVGGRGVGYWFEVFGLRGGTSLAIGGGWPAGRGRRAVAGRRSPVVVQFGKLQFWKQCHWF